MDLLLRLYDWLYYFALPWSLLATQIFSAADAADMILYSDMKTDEDDPEFDDSDSCYSADSTSSSSYTESDSKSDRDIWRNSSHSTNRLSVSDLLKEY